MARASPDVSRQQARYRRLMQISSARSLDVAPPPRSGINTVDDEVGGRRRLQHQHWPRKLQPIVPINGRLLLPPTVQEGADPLSSASSSEETAMSRLGVVHSEDEEEEEEPSSADEGGGVGGEITHTTNTPTTSLLTPTSPTDREFPTTPTWSPVCMATATVAALSPLSLPPKDDPGPGAAAATAAALASTFTVAAAVNGQPTPGTSQFAGRKRKLLVPMNSFNEPP